MRKSIVTVALAGTIAVTGAAFAVPALAEGATTPVATATSPAPGASDGSTGARPSPQPRITDALKGLVTDGTLTQAQSDKVASTLAEKLPRGGHGGMRGITGMHGIGVGKIETAAAKALGVSETDLMTELRAGRSVADVAKEKGVDLSAVTTAVTDAAKTQIAAAVTDGKITQAQADTVTAGLGAKITKELGETHAGGRGGPGWGGGRGGPFGGPDAGSSTPTPATPTS